LDLNLPSFKWMVLLKEILLIKIVLEINLNLKIDLFYRFSILLTIYLLYFINNTDLLIFS
jgi:hypothetical protein